MVNNVDAGLISSPKKPRSYIMWFLLVELCTRENVYQTISLISLLKFTCWS